jgi:hypothetical protein
MELAIRIGKRDAVERYTHSEKIIATATFFIIQIISQMDEKHKYFNQYKCLCYILPATANRFLSLRMIKHQFVQKLSRKKILRGIRIG